MALEAGDGFISGLVATNPVNATDQVAQGDDHIRLIKTAVKGTFPNLTGAVTPTQAQLNILDTANTFDLNHATVDMDGTTWNADYTNIDIDAVTSLTLEGGSTVLVLSAGAAALTGGLGMSGDLTISNASSANVYLIDTDAGSDATRWREFVQGTNWALATRTDANGAGNNAIIIGRSGTTVTSITFAATTIANTGNVTVSGTTLLSGVVTAANIANSTSTTLVAGQLHFITGNATLPNLTAGQWIEVINDSGSAITISKNASDTTYWTATGASVSTSFTLAARGRLSAVCSPAGSVVYVSGTITAAT